MAKTSNPGGKNGVRIVVAGDRGTGKSTLIVTAAADTFPTNVPPLLPPTQLPQDFYPDGVPITIIDTSSNPEDQDKLAEELRRADVVVLTYASDQPGSLHRLSTFWLPELCQLEVKVPVIVGGCKLDLRVEQQQDSLEQVMSPIMQQFWEIEACVECSAFKHIQGVKKTLVLREIPEDEVKKLLSNKESLAACDITVFVHDSSNESSWKRATELLVDVATHGEDTGYEVPCLIIAAKDDLESFPVAIQDSTRISHNMGIEASIPISSKLGDFNNIFRRIVNAAEDPHLSILRLRLGEAGSGTITSETTLSCSFQSELQ